MKAPRVILISGANKKLLLDAFPNHTATRYRWLVAWLVARFSKVDFLLLTYTRCYIAKSSKDFQIKGRKTVIFFNEQEKLCNLHIISS
jgi:hypothetical protein